MSRPYLSIGFRALKLASNFGTNKGSIEDELKRKLDLAYFTINDESARHFEAHDSHFTMYVVSDTFKEMPLIKRYL